MAVLVLIVGALVVYTLTDLDKPQSSTSTSISGKPMILYINQGNGAVNRTNFDSMLNFAKAQGFNTVFFQVCRLGILLFTPSDMQYFVSQAHDYNVTIFFALSFNSTSQRIPVQVYSEGEGGISLDMSNLNGSAQVNLLASLEANYGGETAVTVGPPAPHYGNLKPDLIVLETYAAADRVYIKQGVIGSVEVVETSSEVNYESQVQYSLQNSAGVMVFDYSGLLKKGY